MVTLPVIGRSLVAKAYVWALLVVLLGGAGAVWGAYRLLEQGELDAVRRFGVTHARFIAREVERASGPKGPDPARLQELGPPLHADLAFVPWDQPKRYPGGLRHVKLYFAPEPWKTGTWRIYWIRLERRGKPVGALRVEFLPPVGRRQVPVFAAIAWILGLALLVVPPLVLFVVLPLRRMVRVAQRLGAGDLTTPVAVTRRDELGALEAAFESLRTQLAGMIAQKEALLRDVSHELRGPLSRMAIALPLAREGDPSKYLDKLDREVLAMDLLIGEILELSRARGAGPIERQPLDLALVAAELLAERELQADARGLAVTHDLRAAPTRGEARLVRRAMGNLLDNALKYTPAGGTVHVETAPGARFTVLDDGPGVAAADLPQIFEPFYRPDGSRSRETGGTGLGLAIVRTVAERHGGQATLACPTAGGTRATLVLPPA